MAAALFLWAVLGGLVGGFAKSVFWYESAQSSLGCVVFGIAGGIAGGLVRGPANAFDLGSMSLSLVGAALVLSVYGALAGRAQTARPGSRRAA